MHLASSKPLCRFLLDEALTTADDRADAYITNQWGAGIMHSYDNKIVVFNPEATEAGTYMFSGDDGDAGLAMWDEGEKWVIVAMEDVSHPWYIGKVITAEIASEACGQVEECSCGWVATGNTFNVYNPHDVAWPVDFYVRWTRYPGWVSCGTCVTDWIVEPWTFTEC